MTDLRKAAQQALEALEYAEANHGGDDCYADSITAIREALAQPEQQFTTTRNAWTGTVTYKCNRCGRDDFRSAHSAKFHECEALAQPEQNQFKPDWDAMAVMVEEQQRMAKRIAELEAQQEPVAWMYTGIKSDGSGHGPHLVWRPEYMDAMSASKGTKATPLYTSPPQREPLTDEQISDLWHQAGEQPFKFARMLVNGGGN